MAVRLFSKLSYTVAVPYDKTEIIVPPFVRNLLVVDEKKLGDLPNGIQVVKERKIK